MSLQIKYRPKSFKTFIGNTEVVSSLKNVLKREQPPAAFLFTGNPGTGKTTLGRIVAKELGCSKSDFREFNSSDDRSIDGVRKVIEEVKFSPLSGTKKVYLYDEIHSVLAASQNAMLKLLEEPPEYAHFILCTTNPEKLLPALKRRCHHYNLDPLTSSDSHKLLKRVLKAERVSSTTKPILDKIVEIADGSAGQMLKLLDSVIDMTDEEKAISVLQSAGSGESEVIDMCRVLTNYNMPAKTKWARLKKMLKEYKGDGESARRPILGYLSAVLLNNGDIEVAFMMENFEKNFFDSGKAGLVLACYKAVFGAEE